KSAAFARFQATSDIRHPTSNTQNGSLTMFRKRTFAIGLTAVLFITVLFSFPAVRAAASDFLGLFRVQKFAPISISPEQMATLNQLADEGMAPGELEIIHEPGAITPVGSLKEASSQTGMAVRAITELADPDEIAVVDGGDGRLKIDLKASRALMEAAGADPTLLPDNIDGANVHVTVFPGVQQSWGEKFTLTQAPSPWVEYPENIDAQTLGEAVLQVLGTEPREARRIAKNIDWTGTLLMPIPGEMVTYHEVTIDGVSGVALEPLDGSGGALMWQKDDIIYLFQTEGSTAELLKLVASIN
ncbi:MAG: hypothetical protein ACK2UP_15245, partial [Candidatus Promineifilaceae bacterium]